MGSTNTPPLIFDRRLVAHRRARAARAGEGNFLRDRVVVDMTERLSAVNRVFDLAMELGGEGAFKAAMASASQTDQVGQIITADVAFACATPGGVVASADALPFAPERFDLIVSPLSLHAINDLPGALVQIRHALKPDGLFLAALLGGETLTELRTCLREAESAITGGAGFRVAPMADALDLSQLLQRAGFALPVSDTDRLTVRYANPMRLLQDLRAMGETAAMTDRARRPLRRDVLMEAMARYARGHADPDGKCRARFDIIWATGWAPHPTQQKPLAPGSAQTRLADALGVTERSAGEKAGG